MNPTEDGTGSRITATVQSLQSWRDVHAKLLQMEKGSLSALEGAAAGHQHWVSWALSSGLWLLMPKLKTKENCQIEY